MCFVFCFTPHLDYYAMSSTSLFLNSGLFSIRFFFEVSHKWVLCAPFPVSLRAQVHSLKSPLQFILSCVSYRYNTVVTTLKNKSISDCGTFFFTVVCTHCTSQV